MKDRALCFFFFLLFDLFVFAFIKKENCDFFGLLSYFFFVLSFGKFLSRLWVEFSRYCIDV